MKTVPESLRRIQASRPYTVWARCPFDGTDVAIDDARDEAEAEIRAQSAREEGWEGVWISKTTKESEMSESKHTPGPWAVGKRDSALILYHDPELGTSDQVAHACRIMREWEANARLVAAAPDLLAALESLLAHVTLDVGLPEHEATIIKARRAIARAKEA